MKYFTHLFLLGALLISMQNQAREAAPETISPAIVFHFAQQLQNNLNNISLEMGIEPTPKSAISVSDVSPREVYFQAATLYQKSSQLMFEFTGKEALGIMKLKVNAQPSDVLALLKSANAHLNEVSIRIGIESLIQESVFDENKNPADVFQIIVTLNRNINHLLEFRFSPAHTHQKITEAIAIASAILETYPDATAVFYPGSKVRRIQPKDVYHKMAMMYDNMTPVMEHFGKTCLALGEQEKSRTDIEPSDVYDLTVMMVSQLRYMYSFVPNTKPIKESYYPGKVLPSDVYQRLSILEQQMNELMRVNNITLISKH